MMMWQIGSALGLMLAGTVTFLLRRFRPDTVGQFLRIVGYVHGSIRIRVAKRVSVAAARRLGLRRYAQIMLGSCFPDYLLIPSAKDIRLSIDVIYVRLQLFRGVGQTISDSELVTRYQKRVLIFGEAGSGKTSLLRKTFRDICFAAVARTGDDRLPVHVELRTVDWQECPDAADDAGEWLLSVIRGRFCAVHGVNDPEFLFDSFVETSGVVLFLDGLDEIPAAQSEAAFAAIQGLFPVVFRRSATSTVVATARSQLREVLPRNFLESFSAVYAIKGFGMTDIYTFLQRWPYPDDRTGDASRIYADIQRQPTLAEMCSNPLVLSMYVARDQLYAASESGRPVRLPDTRTEFYNDIVNELILFRRETQVGRVTIGGQMRRTRQEVLGRIALDHLVRFSEPANSIPWGRAARTAGAVLGRGGDDAESALRELAITTGLFLEERRAESIRFLHLTICEYLAAHELAQAHDDVFGEVIDCGVGYGRHDLVAADHRRLWETLCFCVATLPRDKQSAALHRLNTAGVPCELLLRAVRECQGYDSPVFAEAVVEMLVELRDRSGANWDPEWFGKLQLALSCLLDAERVARIRAVPALPSASDFLDQLVCGDPLRFDTIYDMYLRTNPSEALEVARNYRDCFDILGVARLAKAMEQPEIVALGLSRADAFCAGDAESVAWTLALAEAALSHDLVARTLVNQPSTECLTKAVSRVPDRFRWSDVDFLRGTALGSILSVAAHHVGSLPQGWARDLRRTGLLAEVDVTAGRGSGHGRRRVRRAARRPGKCSVSLRSLLPRDETLTARVVLRLAPRSSSARLRGDFVLAHLNDTVHGFGKAGLAPCYRARVRTNAGTITSAYIGADESLLRPGDRPGDDRETTAVQLDDLTLFSPLEQVYLLIDDIESYDYRMPDVVQR